MNLLHPGAGRADRLFDDDAVLAALVAVEQAWLDVLVDAGIAPAAARAELGGLVQPAEVTPFGEDGGNPVIPLLRLLRERVGDAPAHWLHRGLTSQDTLDTALILCVRDVLDRIVADARRQVDAVVGLLDAHGDTVLVGRTLTQPAVPITFGAKLASWLAGVLDAADDLIRVRGTLPVQVGGAAGTLAAIAQLTDAATGLAGALAERLHLVPAPPWHTARAPITRAGDALVTATGAWGRIANDVLTMSRPEIGELSEGTGGGSSTMPHKQNPVLATLVRAAALSAPQLGALLHLAAAESGDERPAGPWHAEWPALQSLARSAVIASGQTTDLLAGLRVHSERMAANVRAAGDALYAERDAIREIAGLPKGDDYVDAAPAIVTSIRERAAVFLGGRP